MKTLLAAVAAALIASAAAPALAKGDYNDVPANDAQYLSCISYANKNYEGGSAASPIKGQTKVQAYCECMWNETPDNFRGNLAKFGETNKGKEANAICEKYSNWGG